MTFESLRKDFYEALKNPDLCHIEAIVKIYLDRQVPPLTLLDEGLIAAMGLIGQEFKASQIWVPEVLLAARNMHRGSNCSNRN